MKCQKDAIASKHRMTRSGKGVSESGQSKPPPLPSLRDRLVKRATTTTSFICMTVNLLQYSLRADVSYFLPIASAYNLLSNKKKDIYKN